MKPVQVPRFMSIGTTVVELREFKEKKMKNRKRKQYFSEIFHAQFCFGMFYLVKSSEVELTLKLKTRTEFPNV